MKKSIAKKWVKALRSGKFKQGQDRLKLNGKYCCLGVLSAISPYKYNYTKMKDEYNMSNVVLPKEVQKWAGMKTEDATTPSVDLISMNDGGDSFSTIANCIEKYWAEL